MSKIAIDIVLFPSDEMSDVAIEANKKIREENNSDYLLTKDEFYPHITMLMGVMEESDIETFGMILKKVIEKVNINELKIKEFLDRTPRHSLFVIEKSIELQQLHDELIKNLSLFLTYNSSEDMFVKPPEIGHEYIVYVNNFLKDVSHKNFFPHITLGKGGADNIEYPKKFKAKSLALTQLGNSCQPRKILFEIIIN